MPENLIITIAQLNFFVGDIAGNKKKILEIREKNSTSDLIVFSELCITGYPPEDLVLNKSFREAARDVINGLAYITTNGPALIVGAPWEEDGKVYNAAFLLAEGKIKVKKFKHHLPNYSVFDEKRVFESGNIETEIFNIKGMNCGILICEDIWFADTFNTMLDTESRKKMEIDLVISLNASPFEIGKYEKRVSQAIIDLKKIGASMIYVNQIGGQDDLVFDGGSFVVNENGEMTTGLECFREEVISTEWAKENNKWICKKGKQVKKYAEEEIIYLAIMLGLKDYVNKNRFPGVILGMSGGIDSALSAAIAVDALGKGRVRLVMIPSRYTSGQSVDDAEDCAKKLGIKLENMPMDDIFSSFEDILAPSFSGKEQDVTEENLQSRIRGSLLMALSNKLGHMVLSTGNKSEIATGYATLYGDMCGGYNAIKDIYKTQVYKIAAWRNKNKPEDAVGPNGNIINESIMVKAPSAELKANQTDQDTLPLYDILDDILYKLIELDLPIEEIAKTGHDIAIVEKVYKMLKNSEYKRRQSAPGPKISIRPFGRDRRYPITSFWWN